MRYGKTSEAGFRSGAQAGCALVTNLAAGSGCRARERRDGRRVVVRFHLAEDVDRLVDVAVLTRAAVRHQARAVPALEHGRVVAVGRDHAAGRLLGGRLDHPEQALVLGLAVDDPAGIEDLVTAVLRIRLREHHELGIGRVAPQLPVAVDQVVDLLV